MSETQDVAPHEHTATVELTEEEALDLVRHTPHYTPGRKVAVRVLETVRAGIADVDPELAVAEAEAYEEAEARAKAEAETDESADQREENKAPSEAKTGGVPAKKTAAKKATAKG